MNTYAFLLKDSALSFVGEIFLFWMRLNDPQQITFMRLNTDAV
jgi:hypothetical protein